MKQANAAAIYARISSDQAGEGLGVQRQVEDCRRLAQERDWTISDEYVDNDVSAFSGKPRPNYERMLTDIQNGHIDAVLVYHLDRLTRRPIELERFIEICTAARVDVTTVTGDVGLGNDNGLMIARITSAMAAAESGRKSARIKRKMQQNAEMGKPHGCALRPFGYEPDKVTVREDEARIIRRLVSRYIAGESLISLARWMNQRGVPTVGRAKGWQVQALRPILTGGRIAGIRDHNGKPAGPAVWPPIISMRQHNRVLARQAANRTERRAPQRYLLSGMLLCGRCGEKLYSTLSQGQRRYGCSSAPGRGGCGKLSVNAFHIEEWAAAAVLQRLDGSAIGAMLIGRAVAQGRSHETAELVRAQDALTALAEMFGAGSISRDEFFAARMVAESRRAAATRHLDRVTNTRAFEGLADDGTEMSMSWSHIDIDRKREIVRSVLHYATVQPRPRGVRKLDVTRVEPTWVL